MTPSRPAQLASAASLLLAIVASSPLAAQDTPCCDPRGPVTAGVALNISRPAGAFDETTNLGWGLSANAVFRVDRNAIFNIRAEAGFLNYGRVNQRVPLSTTVGNLIRVDLNTTNNIFSFVTGPQLLGPTGRFTPYATALGGFSAFWTSSSVEGTNDTEPFASTTNSSDFAWAYGGAAGAYLRVSDGKRPIRLELAVRYLRHDDVTYLTADEVRASITEFRDPVPIRSRVDFYTYVLGVQAIVF